MDLRDLCHNALYWQLPANAKLQTQTIYLPVRVPKLVRSKVLQKPISTSLVLY